MCWQKGWPASRSGLEAVFERMFNVAGSCALGLLFISFLSPRCPIMSHGVSGELLLPYSIFDSFFQFLPWNDGKEDQRKNLTKVKEQVCDEEKIQRVVLFTPQILYFLGWGVDSCALLPIVMFSQTQCSDLVLGPVKKIT